MEVDSGILEIGVDFNEFEDNEKGTKDENFPEENMDVEVDVNCPCPLSQESSSNQPDLRQKIIKNKEGTKYQSTKIENDVGLLERAEEATTLQMKQHRDDNGFKEHSKKRDSRYSQKTLFKELHASSDLDTGILGREIAHRLGEAKVGLIINVVRVLGFKSAMKILEETRRIERRGGMLTTDRSRRRTPGGVYIYCLKEKGYASKEEVELIFKEEKERLKEIAKRKKKDQNLRKRKELQKMDRLKKRVIEFVNKKIAGEDEKINEESITEKNEKSMEVISKTSMEGIGEENTNNNLKGPENL
ncbi:uncharacterized protein LOC135696632 [Rhopilema esculentum]|uniref:uncharacterized protein LOC135696632 n=1 Tax=Rhopilema esculentum TaxID=499914 RepID=UPI0031D2D79E|eukprot:gene13074-3858_t